MIKNAYKISMQLTVHISFDSGAHHFVIFAQHPAKSGSKPQTLTPFCLSVRRFFFPLEGAAPPAGFAGPITPKTP